MKIKITPPPKLKPEHLRKAAAPNALTDMERQMDAIYTKLCSLNAADRQSRREGGNGNTETNYRSAYQTLKELSALRDDAVKMLRNFKRNGPVDRWVVRKLNMWPSILRADLMDAAMYDHGRKMSDLFRLFRSCAQNEAERRAEYD